MVTDWESLTTYHTGDLVTRWSSDASNIASGILNWIPNLIIYTVRFISALAIVIYYDPTFAIFASKNWVLFKKNILECALSFRECQFLLLF